MVSEIERTQTQLDVGLNQSLDNATAIITKNYLENLENYQLISPSLEDIDIDVADCGAFFKLKKLVLNNDENFLHKLTTIVNVVSAIDSSLATVIKSDGTTVDYYFGIISKEYRLDNETDRRRREGNVKSFKGALSGNLQGSEVEELSPEMIREFQEDIFFKKENCYSAVSGVVALRDNQSKSIEGYVQGIENLVDSLKGVKYTIIMLADPISSGEIQIMKQGYEMIYTQLATFLQSSVIINETDSMSLSKARTDGITEGISKGIALTQSTTTTKGKYRGINASIGVSFGITASVGFSGGTNRSTAKTTGRTESTLETQQRSQSVTDTVSSGKNFGKSLQLNYENRSVKALLDKININLERLEECDSFGAFECGAYVIAESKEDAVAVASNYNALMRGQKSSVQASHINTWYKPEDTKILDSYLKAFVHPRFSKNNNIVVTPASIVSGNEIAIQIGLPKKSINGVTVVPMCAFGRNVDQITEEEGVYLGNLYHMGHDEGVKEEKHKVFIDIESLCMHTFITGSTGTGKSTTIYSLLENLMNHKVKGEVDKNIKFMVIEPAKGEYKERFGSNEEVHVYGTNSNKMPLLKLNPFSFPEDIHVLEHIDRLIEIFNVCWPMYAAMPAVLKDSVERAYISAGWNLDKSECKYRDSHGKVLFPNFVDVLLQINKVMEESQYSSDSKGDYKGALCTRIKSLTNGLYGQIFTNNEISSQELFDENVIIDLSRVGSSETKSLIMGLLVMKLQEYRMSQFQGGNQTLRHVTVLEEAHNLLKKTTTQQSMDSENLVGKSVEMLANSIAEMRTYGEGFIIADQAPELLDTSVIRNTNTKIILRLPNLADRELVGRAANLSEEQISEISRLKTFIAAVYQNNWLEPVLCNVDVSFSDSKGYHMKPVNEKNELTEKDYIEYLVMPISERNALDKKYVDQLRDGIWNLPISAEMKMNFVRYQETDTKEEVQRLRAPLIYSIFRADTFLSLAKEKEKNVDEWYKYMYEMLQPDLSLFSEVNQRRIIASIAWIEAQQDKGKDKRFFNELMKRM